eukprot:gene14405-biopygen7452
MNSALWGAGHTWARHGKRRVGETLAGCGQTPSWGQLGRPNDVFGMRTGAEAVTAVGARRPLGNWVTAREPSGKSWEPRRPRSPARQFLRRIVFCYVSLRRFLTVLRADRRREDAPRRAGGGGKAVRRDAPRVAPRALRRPVRRPHLSY